MRIAAFLVFLTLLSPLSAQRGEHEARSTPGVFDYYVLSLSWSPEHCASRAGRNERTQCGGERRFAFVLHGLWPQFERGWPQFCSTGGAPNAGLINSMLDIMPSRKLIEHEWTKHGTCAGIPTQAYFDLARRAYNKVRIPRSFENVSTYLTVEPAEIERRFLASNRALKPDGLSVVCSGRYLQEVRICLDRNLNFRACGKDVGDSCQVSKAVLRPVR